MPRVAVISYTTHSKHLNYGAALHGWAFQQVLQRMGCASVFIDYLPKDLERHAFKWPILGCLRIPVWRHPILFARRTFTWFFSSFANVRKWRKFRRFCRERLTATPRVYTEADLRAADGLDGWTPAVFVCESDVLWKHRRHAAFDRGFFLDFPAARGARRVAYAPSVSNGGYTPEEERRLADYVRGFDAVSSREQAGADWLARLSGRAVPALLDPTLLLTADDYAALADAAPLPAAASGGGYVLLYTCMNYNANMVREARRYAKRLGKRLVEVGNFGVNRVLFGHPVVDDAGVEEWLALFRRADAVVCNSFHGICFALVFQKPFFAFRRQEDDWRFTGLCGDLGLEGRLVARDGAIPADAPPVDFAAAARRLAPRAAASRRFIQTEIVEWADHG